MLPSLPWCRCRRLCAIVLPLLLNSCMTAGLWGYEYRRHRHTLGDPAPASFVAARGTDWSWWRVLLRTVVTPVTVALDVVTLPLQSIAFRGGIQFHP